MHDEAARPVTPVSRRRQSPGPGESRRRASRLSLSRPGDGHSPSLEVPHRQLHVDFKSQVRDCDTVPRAGPQQR
jgi:hypothetical protein